MLPILYNPSGFDHAHEPDVAHPAIVSNKIETDAIIQRDAVRKAMAKRQSQWVRMVTLVLFIWRFVISRGFLVA